MQPELNSAVVYAGTFERSLDAKNRVTIPARWLSGQEEEFQVIPNPSPDEPFLIVMPPAEFAQMENRILALDAPAAEKRKFIRHFYGAARVVSTDKQGRLLLPEDHCRKLKLQGEVVLVGSKSRFEIWNRELWNKASAEELPIYQKMANLIGL
jgi:MraZ protein